MAISRIFLWLGYALIFYAALMFMTSIGGLILREIVAAQIFSGLAILVGLAGLIIAFTAQNAPTRESTRDILIFLLLFWTIIPVATALPFISLQTVPSGLVAYFESMSAITTTGASTLVPEEIPRTLVLWRAVLQWSGGCVVATFAVVLLAALNLSGIGIHKSIFFTMKRGELFSRLVEIGRIIALLYATIAFLCFGFLMLAGTPVFDAFCLGLSAVSTGGLTPRSGMLNSYVSNIGGIVLALTCLLGAANVSILWDLVRRRTWTAVKATLFNVEHRGTLVIVGIFIVTGFLYSGHIHLHTVAVEAAYLASTTGFDFHVIGVDIISPSILIALSLVGGSALSTAGGIKIIRMLLLLRHLRTDLDRMSHPSRVMPVRFKGQQIEDKAFLSIWMYFFGYTLVFAMGTIALGASGVDFTYAVAACAAALSNTGPLLQATYPEITYASMNQMSQGILIVVMLLGRVEVLVILAAISPSQWRR
jgi:trk system potassium uptake protein TrkH